MGPPQGPKGFFLYFQGISKNFKVNSVLNVLKLSLLMVNDGQDLPQASQFLHLHRGPHSSYGKKGPFSLFSLFGYTDSYNGVISYAGMVDHSCQKETYLTNIISGVIRRPPMPKK